MATKPEYCDTCDKKTSKLTMHVETEQEYPGAYVWRTEVWNCIDCNKISGYTNRPILENNCGW